MKKFLHIFLIICLALLPLPAASEEFFEGVLSFKMGTQGKQTEMKYFMKGSKMRMQIDIAPGMSSAGIADYEKKKIYMLMGQNSMYTEMDIDEKVLAESAGKTFDKSEVIETGETQEILGYTCAKIVSKKGDETTEIWIAKGFGKFYQPEMGEKNPTFLALKKKFEEEKAFPFRIITLSPDNKELFKMEVVNVDKKSLDDSLFQIPAGYKKVSMPGAIRGK